MASGAFAIAAQTAVDFQPMMYMQEYLEQKSAEGQHPASIRGAKNALHYFGEFSKGQDIVSPEEITRTHLIRFQAWCNEKVTREEWKKSYAVKVLKNVRAWINWMVDLGYITHQPWNQIKVPKVDKEPKPLSDEDLNLLFNAHARDAFQIDPFVFHRRETILCLLYGWGLRIHELEALTVDKFNSRLDFVIVKNKGGGTKRLPYTPEIKSTVERWLAQRAKHAVPGEDSLLITSQGTMLTKEYMYTIITGLGAKAGVTVNPHRLRDTFGTHMLDDDVPVERVKAVFGHTNVRQTLAYARVNDKKVYESLESSMDPRLRDLFRNTRDLR